MPLVLLNATGEQHEAVREEAKVLATAMREQSLAEFALLASARIEELEAARRAEMAAHAADTINYWKSKPLSELAANLRARIESEIELVPQTTDRLAVARDRLTGIIEILGR